ncbi:RHS repeat domain-containing protein [Sunxiuqinia sp. A32]|uniref:RHS repeat domain-containing protein n=1 Tax=Sunxiuqinia sp. A32 TaxID=3461496 RepID=UPI00404627E4
MLKQQISLLIILLISFVLSAQAQKGTDKVKPEKPDKDSTEVFTVETISEETLETQVESAVMETMNSSFSSQVVIPSPEVEMITKFNDYPVDMQTGLPEINIPLYEVVCGELKLPITLSYHASGRKTYDRNGPIGLHWVLNTGGLISRTVYGIRDDDIWQFPSPFPIIENLSIENDYDFLAGVINKSPGIITYYDTEYDVFSYSYNGSSGNFILKDINNVKVPEVIPNKKIQVNVHKTSSPNDHFDYIEILDEFGVYYRFGKSLVSGDDNRETTETATTAWFISEIISASKQDTIHFKYITTGKVRRTFPQRIKLRDNHHFEGYYDVASIADPSDSEETFSTSYGSARISEIVFRKGKIHFTFNGSTDIIDKMDVYYDTELLRTIEFPKTLLDAPSGLSTFDASQALIYKLDNVYFKDKNGTLVNKYGFDYFPSANFNVRQSDWWGYYNGESSIYYRIPVFDNIPWVGTGGETSTISIGSATAYRTPNLQAMESGMLKSVTYPTGGKMEFTYENNYYKEALTPNVKECGGLRIAQKKITDSTGKTITKTYKYGKDECGYGFINYEPGIGMIGYENTLVTFYEWDGNCFPYDNMNLEYLRERYYFSDILPQYSIYFDRPVMYPEVTEYIGESVNNEGKTKYKYEYSGQRFAEMEYNSSDWSIHRKYVRLFDYWRNNQLLEKIIFDSNGNKIEKEVYSYVLKPKEEIKGMHLEQLNFYQDYQAQECASTFPHQIFSWEEYTVSSGIKLLSSQVNTMYYGSSDSVETKINYTYNDNQLLSKTETIDDKGNLVTNYYYPDDYNAVQNFSVLRDPAKNIVGKPVDKRTYKGSQLVSGTQTIYNDYGQPTDIFAVEIGEGLTDIQFDAADPYKFTHKGTYLYNTDQRIKQEVPEDNINTYYLWAYNNQYPIAKIESPEDLIDIEPIQLAINGLSLSGNDDKAAIDTDIGQIRVEISSSLGELDMLTIYTYKPLVGMTSQTDPSGRTTYYEYDDFGRLQYVRDTEGNIVNKYRYHYATQD